MNHKLLQQIYKLKTRVIKAYDVVFREATQGVPVDKKKLKASLIASITTAQRILKTIDEE